MASKNRRAKCSRTHSRSGGKILDCHWFIEMLLNPGHRVREQVGTLEYGQWPIDVLGLTPVALGWNDQLPGQLGSDLASIILPDKVQTQIYAGCAAGSGEDVALVDK